MGPRGHAKYEVINPWDIHLFVKTIGVEDLFLFAFKNLRGSFC